MTTRRVSGVCIGVSAALACCGPARALELFDGFQVHGFLSQAYILTSDNRVFGKSDEGGSFGFTETGINASWLPTGRLQLATQVLYRRAGQGNEGDVELDFGLIDYSILTAADYQFGIRLGRIKNTFGLYSDTRDVAFTRPTILLPQSIYFDRTRKVGLSADGVHLYGRYGGSWGDLLFNFGPAFFRVNNRDTELALLRIDRPGELDSELSFIGRVIYERDAGRWRLAFSAIDLDISYKPASPPADRDLGPGEIRFRPWFFSGQYNGEHWSFTAEYALRQFDFEGFSQPRTTFDGESYYLQAAYRINASWEVVARYDTLFADRDDRDGTKFKANDPCNFAPTPCTRTAYQRFAKDWTVGVRYDVTDSLMVRAEYHHVDGTGWLPVQDNPDPTTLEREWDLFALLIAFRF